MNFTFTLDLKVFDPAQLHAAACQHMLDEDAENGFYPRDPVARTSKLLGTPDNPDVKACLAMLLDPGSLPGCSIGNHSVEADEVMDVDLGDEDQDPRGGSDE